MPLASAAQALDVGDVVLAVAALLRVTWLEAPLAHLAARPHRTLAGNMVSSTPTAGFPPPAAMVLVPPCAVAVSADKVHRHPIPHWPGCHRPMPSPLQPPVEQLAGTAIAAYSTCR